MNPVEKIEGNRLNLYRIEKNSHFVKIFYKNVLESMKELQPWLVWAKPEYAMEEVYVYLTSCDEAWREGNNFTYTLKTPKGNFMGVLSFKPDKQNKSAILGYWLSTKYAGCGYMQEAVKLLEQEIFANGFNKIVIRTDVLNLKSANIPQKLSYHLDGVLRQEMYVNQEGCYRDINIFSKLKSEYK